MNLANAYRIALLFVTSIFMGRAVWAGGGPENVFLVVNSADQNSLAIANHFVELRKIPVGSVFYIDLPSAPHEIPVDRFREQILGPTLDEIQRRNLQRQIDYIIYSSGFPEAINYKSDMTAANRRSSDSRMPPVGSITGMTYLHELVMEKDVTYMDKRPNVYAANVLPQSDGFSAGFRARYGLDSFGKRVDKNSKGQHFQLSMVLGCVRGPKNNTLFEVFRYLNNGVKGDATSPDGTFYFVRNNDIRSRVRHGFFPDVIQELKDLGVNAEEIEGQRNERDSLPLRKDDVMGAVIGHATFAWGLTESTFLPGAIAENFTSFGGRMSGTSQTLLCNFLKFGAVASSGTVAEPLALGRKFPHPRLYLHYARGCSVAESFYQSVGSPYQLLIVGDPLCQPWATPPTVKIRGLSTRKKQSGTIEFTAETDSPAGHEIRNLELYIDGQLVSRMLPDKPITIDTTRLANGYHELRVVAIEDTPIETQGRAITGFVCLNQASASSRANLSAKLRNPKAILRTGQPAYVRVRSPGAREIRIYRGRDVIGTLNGDNGQIAINPAELGGGSVSLRPVAFPLDRAEKPIFGLPLKVTVELPRTPAPPKP